MSAPSRRAFGSRLLEKVLSSDLEGQCRLEFAADGVLLDYPGPRRKPLFRLCCATLNLLLETQHSRSNYAKQPADYHYQPLRREDAIELSRNSFGFFLHGTV